MSKISIIVATYNVPNYLDECINSIIKQQVNFGVEIIIGIDGCEKTLNHIRENEMRYNKCKVFYFPDNMLTFFHQEIRRSDIIRFTFQNFRILDKKTLGVVENAWGVIGIKKGIFKSLNGYYSWRCNADVEFIQRAVHNRFKVNSPNKIVFHRREHTYNLTRRLDTGMQSDIRKIYEEEINIRRKTKKWPNPETIIQPYTAINEIYST